MGVFPLEAFNYIAKVYTPFVIAENLRQFYYKGLAEWRKGAQVRLRDTCGTGQDIFKALLTKLGYSWLVKGAELQETSSTFFNNRTRVMDNAAVEWCK